MCLNCVTNKIYQKHKKNKKNKKPETKETQLINNSEFSRNFQQYKQIFMLL